MKKKSNPQNFLIFRLRGAAQLLREVNHIDPLEVKLAITCINVIIQKINPKSKLEVYAK